MILLQLLRGGLWRTLDAEKLRYFFGRTAHPLFLSRRDPPWRRMHLVRMMVSPAYARGVAQWLRYRADLYDGRQG
jgi:hypothetical protein